MPTVEILYYDFVVLMVFVLSYLYSIFSPRYPIIKFPPHFLYFHYLSHQKWWMDSVLPSMVQFAIFRTINSTSTSKFIAMECRFASANKIAMRSQTPYIKTFQMKYRFRSCVSQISHIRSYYAFSSHVILNFQHQCLAFSNRGGLRVHVCALYILVTVDFQHSLM